MNDGNDVITVKDLDNLIGELRSMARRLLRSESNPQSLTPTALALSALRRAKSPDADWDDLRWENRKHFFGVLTMTMGHALIDHARRARAKFRKKLSFLPWDDKVLLNLSGEAEERPERYFALDEGLTILRADNPELAEVIEQYFYAGYSIPEIARFSNVSEKTVDRRLAKARVALAKILRNRSGTT